MTPIANARMYSATPAARQAWMEVLAWSLEQAGLGWEVVAHDAPAPLSDLWARSDLGCALMCGLPYSQRAPRPTLIAAALPSPERYGGRPVYFTDIVVRAGARYATLEDTFGGVAGYTLPDSMSGCVAFRAHLLRYRTRQGPKLYRAAVGGFLNARRVIEALDAGEIDVGPLDSYYHDLLRKSDPALAAKVRVIESTGAAPIPPFVATAPLAAGALECLRSALLTAAEAPALAAQRDTLLLAGFAVPPESHYDTIREILAASRQFPDAW